jgi:dihydroflavonol-4-reductase
LKWLAGLPVECVEGDLFNPASILKCLGGAEYIIHIAGTTKANRRQDYLAGNVETTKNVLLAASQLKNLKKLCFVSSLTAVGPSATGAPLKETANCHPITAYGKSKLEAEHLCISYAGKMPIVIIRPPAVFGPRDTDILEVFKWVSLGIKPVLGTTAKTVSLVYAPDLAQGIIRATFHEKTVGEIYNIADATIFTFTSVMDILARCMDKRIVQIYLPKILVYSMAGVSQFLAFWSSKPAVLNIEKARDLLQTHWVCDTQKIHDQIGFQTSTPLDKAINTTLQWYKVRDWL